MFHSKYVAVSAHRWIPEKIQIISRLVSGFSIYDDYKLKTIQRFSFQWTQQYRPISIWSVW